MCFLRIDCKGFFNFISQDCNLHRSGHVQLLDLTLFSSPMKEKPSYNDRRCKIRINIKRFEAIQLNENDWGYPTFYHCLN